MLGGIEICTVGLKLHDRHISSNRELDLPDFKASKTWIKAFKKANRLVSRKITKFVTKEAIVSESETAKSAKEFVELASQDIVYHRTDVVFNTDQSGISDEPN